MISTRILILETLVQSIPYALEQCQCKLSLVVLTHDVAVIPT